MLYLNMRGENIVTLDFRMMITTMNTRLEDFMDRNVIFNQIIVYLCMPVFTKNIHTEYIYLIIY